MKKVKKIKQVDTQNIRKFVINRNSKDNRQTLQTSISAKRPFLIRRSRSQQIPLLVISYQLNQSKRESLTVTEQFLKKAEHEKVHPIPSAFSLIKIEKKEKKLEYNEYQSLKFSILSYTNSKLIDVALEIVTKFGLLQFSSRLAINRLIKQIQLGYNVVSYHHFAHGFSLMHMYYHLVKMDKKFRSLFTKQEIGFTLIAALAHDLNHKGNNNAYQVKINSELSISANKQSVLQKMHIKTFFNILKGKNISLLQKSKNPRKNKELIIRAILSTDVAKHFKGVQQLKQLRQKNEFDPTNNQHRYFAMQQAFHACDIGNPCLQFQDYINWAALLTYEFDYQTAMEAKKGVEVTQMLRYKGIKQFYSGQIGFINFLAYPLWKQLSGIWSGFTPLVSNIQKNLKMLKQKETQSTL